MSRRTWSRSRSTTGSDQRSRKTQPTRRSAAPKTQLRYSNFSASSSTVAGSTAPRNETRSIDACAAKGRRGALGFSNRAVVRSVNAAAFAPVGRRTPPRRSSVQQQGGPHRQSFGPRADRHRHRLVARAAVVVEMPTADGTCGCPRSGAARATARRSAPPRRSFIATGHPRHVQPHRFLRSPRFLIEQAGSEAQHRTSVPSECHRDRFGLEPPGQVGYRVILKKDLRAPYWEGRTRNVN